MSYTIKESAHFNKSMQELQGKYYEQFSITGTVIARIKIKHIKLEHIPAKMYDDGSVSEPKVRTLVSANGYLWYRFDSPCTRIV